MIKRKPSAVFPLLVRQRDQDGQLSVMTYRFRTKREQKQLIQLCEWKKIVKMIPKDKSK